MGSATPGPAGRGHLRVISNDSQSPLHRAAVQSVWCSVFGCISEGTPGEEPDPGTLGSTGSPINESGGSDSAALPVHLGLRDEASALQPLHSGTCNVHRGLTRGLWKSPESFSSILNDWVGLKLSR